jgi:hypothetical protein
VQAVNPVYFICQKFHTHGEEEEEEVHDAFVVIWG